MVITSKSCHFKYRDQRKKLMIIARNDAVLYRLHSNMQFLPAQRRNTNQHKKDIEPFTEPEADHRTMWFALIP